MRRAPIPHAILIRIVSIHARAPRAAVGNPGIAPKVGCQKYTTQCGTKPAADGAALWPSLPLKYTWSRGYMYRGRRGRAHRSSTGPVEHASALNGQASGCTRPHHTHGMHPHRARQQPCLDSVNPSQSFPGASSPSLWTLESDVHGIVCKLACLCLIVPLRRRLPWPPPPPPRV